MHEIRDRLACVALVLLVLIAVLTPSIERSSASDFQRLPTGLRRSFALPASDVSHRSPTASILREDPVVGVRLEDDEDDDEPCGPARQACDTCDPSHSPSRSAPTRHLAVPGRVSAVHPLRC
jgi:hypothetical protein